MRFKQYDELISYTPIDEISICENCPYEDCIGIGTNECDYYRNKKKILKENRKKVKKCQ